MSLGPPDLSGVVDSFSFPVIRRRYDTPATSRGLTRSTGYTDTVIMMHLWIAPADVTEKVFPGQEGVIAYEFSTTADIRTTNTAIAPYQRADDILFRGRQAEAVDITDWNAGPAGDRSYIRGVAREVTR